MSSPLTCPDCGARREFVGFESTRNDGNDIRVFQCDACGLIEKLEIAGRQAVVIARSHVSGAKMD